MAASVWVQGTDPSPTHSECHRSNGTGDKQKQASPCRNPFPDQDTDSQHSTARLGLWETSEYGSVVALTRPVPPSSPQPRQQRVMSHLSIHKRLSSSRSPPRVVGAAGLFPEVCPLHLQPRTSVSRWLISKKLHCPHEGGNSSPFPPASSPSLQLVLLPHPLGLLFPLLSSLLLFITGPPPSTWEWYGLLEGAQGPGPGP